MGDTRQEVLEVISRTNCRYRACRIPTQLCRIYLPQRRRFECSENFLGVAERRSVQRRWERIFQKCWVERPKAIFKVLFCRPHDRFKHIKSDIAASTTDAPIAKKAGAFTPASQFYFTGTA